MSMKIRILAVLLLAGLLAGIGGYGLWWEHKRADHLTLYGNVDIREVSLAFRVDGRVAAVLVDEGDAVEAGQPLARLETDYLGDAVNAAQANADVAKAQLDELENGTRKEDVDKADAAVRQAMSAYENAQSTYKRVASLAADSNASKQALDNARDAMQQTEAALSAARATLDLALAGARIETRDMARAQLSAAEAALSIAKRRLADAELVAPSRGIIKTRVHEPGAMLAAGSPMFSLSLVSPVYVRAYVSEPGLVQVRPGMKAEVTADGLPGRVFAGQVGFISPVAEFTPKTVETTDLRASLVYRLRIILDGAPEELRQGMPVTVRLVP